MTGSSSAEWQNEKNTLLYEAMILRQAVGSLGGEVPKTYVAGKNPVMEMKAELEAVKEELKSLKRRERGSIVEEDNVNPKVTPKVINPLVLAEDGTISYKSFEVGCTALFMPIGSIKSKRAYLAFNDGSRPNHYLSTTSIDLRKTGGRWPDFVLGRIVFHEEKVAKGERGGEGNPFGLGEGTGFFLLHVEVL